MTRKAEITINVNKMTEEARDNLFRAFEKESVRKKANLQFTAGVLVAELGQDGAEKFLKKIDGLDRGEAHFFGSEGLEKTRSKMSAQTDVGYSVDPVFGANFALRGVDNEGNKMVVALDFDAAVAITRALHNHLALMDDENLAKGQGMRDKYAELMGWIAETHTDLSGARAEAHRQARYQAELTIRAHANAAEQKAVEVAEHRVESVVRKLAQAAAMPAGIEKSIFLEEAQPMIQRAFSGVNK